MLQSIECNRYKGIAFPVVSLEIKCEGLSVMTTATSWGVMMPSHGRTVTRRWDVACLAGPKSSFGPHKNSGQLDIPYVL